jgi:transcriptional regulator with XRE-family HTH domain
VAGRWTQEEFAHHLHLSQGRLSDLERGNGSFTSEQFLKILTLFNIPTSHFAANAASHDSQLQNALARLTPTPPPHVHCAKTENRGHSGQAKKYRAPLPPAGSGQPVKSFGAERRNTNTIGVSQPAQFSSTGS